MRLELDFEDVLIRPQIKHNKTNKVVHRADVKIDTHNSFCPIMPANMTQTGTFKIAEKMLENGMMATLHKFYTATDILKFLKRYLTTHPITDLSGLFITIGLRDKEEEIEKLRQINKEYEGWNILVDVPNATIPTVLTFTKELHQEFPNHIIAVGNVATVKGVRRLIKAGADIIKIGIGPSKNACTTRLKTGCGRPQFSAVKVCSRYAHFRKVKIIADGGFKTTGDLCKAFVAGADYCMSGFFFAGCKEAAGRKIKNFKEYYGMSSFRAQKENYGVVTRSGTSEGEEKLIPYTGEIINTINDIKGSLRSCGSYLGCDNLGKFRKFGKFYRVLRIK